MTTQDNVSDETLASLPADGRRVIRLMAQGGWSNGRPSLAAVERTCDALGLTFRDEQNRGEPRAFWPAGSEHAVWRRLATRLETVKPSPVSAPKPPKRKASTAKPRTSPTATLVDAIRDAVLPEGRLTPKEAARGADAARTHLLSAIATEEFQDRLDAAVYAGVTSSGFRADRSADAVFDLIRDLVKNA